MYDIDELPLIEIDAEDEVEFYPAIVNFEGDTIHIIYEDPYGGFADDQLMFGGGEDDPLMIFYPDEEEDLEHFFKKGWLKRSARKVADLGKTAINVTTAPARGLIGIGKNNKLEEKLQLKTKGDGFTKFNKGVTQYGRIAGPAAATIAGGVLLAPVVGTGLAAGGGLSGAAGALKGSGVIKGLASNAISTSKNPGSESLVPMGDKPADQRIPTEMNDPKPDKPKPNYRLWAAIAGGGLLLITLVVLIIKKS